MKTSDKPLTKQDLKEVLAELEVVTKKDLEGFATKQDLENFATKQDIESIKIATKQDINEVKLDVKGLRQKLKDGINDMSEVVTDAMQVIANKLDENERRDAKRWRANTQAHLRTQKRLDKMTGMVGRHDSEIKELQEAVA